MNMTPHILVVDDNPTNLKLVARVLEADGLIVSGAVDAEQALVLLEQSVPNLILMDLALPGMDGISLMRRLRLEKRFEQMPIIAFTAYAMKGDDADALQAGCDGYISKPIDTRKFAATVRAFLDVRCTRSVTH
jgi:CheY-like chemotaxis protein